MADYYSILRNAIEEMDASTAEERAAIYERARLALRAQIEAIDPPLAEDAAQAQWQAIDSAIERVEADIVVAGGDDAAPPEPALSEPDLPAPEERKISELVSSEPAEPELPEPVLPEPVLPEPVAPEPALPTAEDAITPQEPREADDAASEAAQPSPAGGAALADMPEDGADAETAASEASASETPADQDASRDVPSAGDAAIAAADSGPAAKPSDDGGAAIVPAASVAAIDTPIVETGPEPAAPKPAGDLDIAPRRAEDERLEPRLEVASETPGPVLRAPQGADPALGHGAPPRRRGRLVMLAILLLLVLGGGAAAYMNWDGARALVAQYTGTTGADHAGGGAGEPGPSGGAVLEETASGDAIGQGPVGDEAAPDIVAAQTPSATDDDAPAAEESNAQAAARAETEDDGRPALATPPTELGMLAMESTPGGSAQDDVRYMGSTRWNLAGAGGDAVLSAVISIPERQSTFTIEMRLNADAGLPASHTLQFIHQPGPDDADGPLTSVPGLLLRVSEDDQGQPIRGAGAQIIPGQFLMALKDGRNDRIHNINLLKQGQWFVVPVMMQSQKRGLLVFSKGETGAEALDRALEAWGDDTPPPGAASVPPGVTRMQVPQSQATPQSGGTASGGQPAPMPPAAPAAN